MFRPAVRLLRCRLESGLVRFGGACDGFEALLVGGWLANQRSALARVGNWMRWLGSARFTTQTRCDSFMCSSVGGGAGAGRVLENSREKLNARLLIASQRACVSESRWWVR